MKMRSLFIIIQLLFFVNLGNAQHSVAREWNEILLESIRGDYARPTIHARNLFHISLAMYDAWAVFDKNASTHFLGQNVNNFNCPFYGIAIPDNIEAAQKEAISFAVYRLLEDRFEFAPNKSHLETVRNNFMMELGYNVNDITTDYSAGSAAGLGNYIASQIIKYGNFDGSRQMHGYTNEFYEPINKSLIIQAPGNPDFTNYNRWQPLSLTVFKDQAGNILPGNTPPFLSPYWGNVSPFALTTNNLNTYIKNDVAYKVYHDPGAPPLCDTLSGPKTLSNLDEYKWGFTLVASWSAHLNIEDGVLWDISPASIGNIQTYPTSFNGMKNFYDFTNGGDASIGHTVNPKTGLPYATQMVNRGDYTRVLAEFWADGPDSETPPGHWFTILNYVNDHPDFKKKYEGEGKIVDDLEWDVKAYLAMGGAMHDAAITAWGAKGYYDYVRPVSVIRCMADHGQCSNPSLANYSKGGLPLIPGFIETVESTDMLAGFAYENVGKIKIYTWRGPDYIDNTETDNAGVGWILAESWWPYQRPSFVTPPFAGYVSGHSTFSRAAAEVMTALTGDPFFPGGMGQFSAAKNEFLVFEEGPGEDVILQWATYRDASDQCSLSRIWGGIHPPADDIPGRLMGLKIGQDAFSNAKKYSIGDVCVDHRMVADDVIDAGIYAANSKLSSNSKILNGVNVAYSAGETVALEIGFETDRSSTFYADIAACN